MNTTDKILSLIQSGMETTPEIAVQLPEVPNKNLLNLIVSLRKKGLIETPIFTVDKKGETHHPTPQIYRITEQGIEKLRRVGFIQQSVFAQVLTIWRTESEGVNKWYRAGELNIALSQVAKKHDLYWQWKNGAGLGKYLSVNEKKLKKIFGLKIQDAKSARVGKKYKFK